MTILSCLGKLFTAVLNERLCKYSNEVNLLEDNQFGFRSSYSTTDSIFTLYSFFEILKSKKKKIFYAFIDFEKAFDKVWRNALWFKLLQSNINRKIYNVIFNLYQKLKSCVTYNDCKTEFFPCEMGVRQGKNLSPFLFSIFVNDIQDFFQNENITGLQTVSDCIEQKLNIFF